MLAYLKRLRDNFINFWQSITSVLNYKNTEAFITDQWQVLKKEKGIISYKLANLRIINIEVGLYHYYHNRFKDAIFRFKLLRLFCKEEVLIPYNLGRCYYKVGKYHLAINEFNKAKALINSLDEEINFYLQKINSPNTINSIPLNLVKEKFEMLAPSYIEKYLIPNNYLGHHFILEPISLFFGKQLINIDILDLGCGTGICAHYLRMYGIGNILDGVDLSANMLQIANKCLVESKPVYNNLHQASIIDFLQISLKEYHLIISVEAFIYIGELQNIIELCKQRLNKNGLLIFIVRSQHKGPTLNFDTEKDIFSYSEQYIRNLISNTGMKLYQLEEIELYNKTPALLCAIENNAPPSLY